MSMAVRLTKVYWEKASAPRRDEIKYKFRSMWRVWIAVNGPRIAQSETFSYEEGILTILYSHPRIFKSATK